MNLSEWGRRQGVSYQTAWRWVKNGTMPVPARQALSGTWLVDNPPAAPAAAQGRVIAYCRVSPEDQMPDLDRQTARVVEGANLLGLAVGEAVGEVVKEIGSGLNGRRRKLYRVLSDAKVDVIVVERRDRLARFGVGHRETVLSASGRRLVVLDPQESTDDLVREMTDVLTSMCAHVFGQRVAREHAVRAATGQDAG